MKHDYEKALLKLNSPRSAFPDERSVWFTDDEYKAVDHALRMMQKLQEPSDGMKNAGFETCNRVSGCSRYPDEPCSYCNKGFDKRDGCGNVAVSSFKAMLEQAEREIEND